MTNAPPLTGAMLIGADRVHGSGGELHAVDPRTGRRLEPTYGLGGAEELADDNPLDLLRRADGRYESLAGRPS